MKLLASVELARLKEILQQKEAELIEVSQQRDAITIEKSADQMDEIQYASERDLAIQNVDRWSSLLRSVKAALRRIQEGAFGICIECELPVSPKRLAAVPWALRCIRCQDLSDQNRLGESNSSEDLATAA